MPNMVDYEKDPRPDLVSDHVLWVALLTTAKERNSDLFGILHALRCGGASLERDKDFGMLIRPGEWEKTEYEAFRAKHLAPRKAEVVEALRLAAQRLPQLQKNTLRSRIASRVKQVEPRASRLGWSRKELWSESTFRDSRDGRQRESLYMALLGASQTWGHAELGEITAEHAEIVVTSPGGRKNVLKLYRIISGAQSLFAHPKNESSEEKKEAV